MLINCKENNYLQPATFLECDVFVSPQLHRVQGQHLRVVEPKTSGSSGGQRNLRYGRAKGH